MAEKEHTNVAKQCTASTETSKVEAETSASEKTWAEEVAASRETIEVTARTSASTQTFTETIGHVQATTKIEAGTSASTQTGPEMIQDVVATTEIEAGTSASKKTWAEEIEEHIAATAAKDKTTKETRAEEMGDSKACTEGKAETSAAQKTLTEKATPSKITTEVKTETSAAQKSLTAKDPPSKVTIEVKGETSAAEKSSTEKATHTKVTTEVKAEPSDSKQSRAEEIGDAILYTQIKGDTSVVSCKKYRPIQFQRTSKVTTEVKTGALSSKKTQAEEIGDVEATTKVKVEMPPSKKGRAKLPIPTEVTTETKAGTSASKMTRPDETGDAEAITEVKDETPTSKKGRKQCIPSKVTAEALAGSSIFIKTQPKEIGDAGATTEVKAPTPTSKKGKKQSTPSKVTSGFIGGTTIVIKIQAEESGDVKEAAEGQGGPLTSKKAEAKQATPSKVTTEVKAETSAAPTTLTEKATASKDTTEVKAETSAAQITLTEKATPSKVTTEVKAETSAAQKSLTAKDTPSKVTIEVQGETSAAQKYLTEKATASIDITEVKAETSAAQMTLTEKTTPSKVTIGVIDTSASKKSWAEEIEEHIAATAAKDKTAKETRAEEVTPSIITTEVRAETSGEQKALTEKATASEVKAGTSDSSQAEEIDDSRATTEVEADTSPSDTSYSEEMREFKAAIEAHVAAQVKKMDGTETMSDPGLTRRKETDVIEPSTESSDETSHGTEEAEIITLADVISRLSKSFRDKVCGGCFLYMSSLPIRMTSRGFPICGRCYNSEEFKDVPSVISNVNTFASHFQFFCVNTYDGCLVTNLNPTEVKDHEKRCTVTQVDCVFCSFKGNNLQIIHHSIRQHRNNLCLDGVIEFSLKENTTRKTLLVLLKGFAFVLKWQIFEERVLLKIRLLTTAPLTRHYRIQFSRKGDAELPGAMLNEYGVLSMKCDTCVDISKAQLKLKFGEEAILMCKISFEEVPTEKKMEECEERESRCDPKALAESLNETEVSADLKATVELSKSVSKFLKTFAHRLLKCIVCKRIATGKWTHYCPELHGCCNKCWTGYCSECSEVKPYRDIPMLDNLAVECDWPGCTEETEFYKYLTHKASCPQRRYRCPLKNCNEIRVGVPALTSHWHCEFPEVVVGNVYEFNKNFLKTEYVYWIQQGDIYVVTINLEDTYLDVLLEEVDVVPNCNFDMLSCVLLLGEDTYDIPMVRSYRKCEGKFVYKERITNYKPENKSLAVVINMNPDVPYQRSLVSVPAQRKSSTIFTV